MMVAISIQLAGGYCKLPIADGSTTSAADEGVEIITGELTKEQLAEIKKAEAEDPLMIAAGGDSNFVRWYRYEQAKEEFLKENPVDVVANAVERLKGPASSLFIIGAGFYSIPLVRGLADGIRNGNVFGTITTSLSNPTDSVNGLF